MLNQLITSNRQQIIALTRAKFTTSSNLRAADQEIEKGIPLFLDELSDTLRLSLSDDGAMEASAAKYGHALFRMGFSVSQVVHGYGDVCQAVTELALEQDAPISTREFRILNRCLDSAIASAVTVYAREREEGISRRGTERLGQLAHELRNSLSTALLAFATLKRGAVGPDSSTGALLNRSLVRLRDLIDRSLSEVRLEAGAVQLEAVSVKDLIEEVAIAASSDAGNRGVSFSVAPFDLKLQIEADRHLLLGAIENVVQNALKFTRRGGHILLTVHEQNGQVLIDVEDECGGLPPKAAEQMFCAFQQHGADRTGLGLGLWISRSSLQTMGGHLSVRDIAGKGCVFSISLPKRTLA